MRQSPGVVTKVREGDSQINLISEKSHKLRVLGRSACAIKQFEQPVMSLNAGGSSADYLGTSI